MKRSTLSFASILIVFAFHVAATNAQVAQQAGGPFPQAMPLPGAVVMPATSQPATPAAPKSREVIPGAMDVRFRDGSTLKVKLKDKQIEFETPYGRLSIPVGDIHKIEVGVHPTAEERKRIDTALSDLSHAEAKRRDAAAADLLALPEKAYPALVLQTRSEDVGVAGRAAAVLEKLRAKVPADILEKCHLDVIHTTESKITGRFMGQSLRIGTLAFGEVDMKFADVRDMQSRYSEKDSVVLLGPGEMQRHLTALCPAARGIRVSIADNGNLKVEVDVRAEEDVAPLMLKITSLPEMAPYQSRRDIIFQIVTAVPVLPAGAGLPLPPQ